MCLVSGSFALFAPGCAFARVHTAITVVQGLARVRPRPPLPRPARLVIDRVPELGNYWFCWQVTNLRNRFRRQDIRLFSLDRPRTAAHSAQVVGRLRGRRNPVSLRSPRLLDRRDVFSRRRDYGENPC